MGVTYEIKIMKNEDELKFTEEEWREKDEKEREKTIKAYADVTIQIIFFLILFFGLFWVEGSLLNLIFEPSSFPGLFCYSCYLGDNSMWILLVILVINFTIAHKITKKVFKL